MKGVDIGPIVWDKQGFGYQRFKLPATKCYDGRGRCLSPALPNAHVKVWYQGAEGGRQFVGRADTVAKARALIRKHKQGGLLCR